MPKFSRRLTKKFTQKFAALGRALMGGGKTHFKEQLNRLHPHDQADYLFNSQPGRKLGRNLHAILTPGELAKSLSHLAPERRASYLKGLKLKRSSKILASMHLDDAVDTLAHFTPLEIEHYLSLIDATLADETRQLLSYENQSAGSLMTTEFVLLRNHQTAAEALETLKIEALKAVTVYYAFVVSDNGVLLNIISLKELLLSAKDAPISELNQKNIISINVKDSRVRAAQLLQDYNLLALPVLDDYSRILGIITIDDVVDVIDQQASDSFSKLSAAADLKLSDGPLVSARKRLPWLLLLLLLGMITAGLIGQFEDTIAKVAILGAFIPVVAGTTGNSGTQSLAVMVRGISTGKLANLRLGHFFLKEATTALLTSIVCGLALTLIIFIWKSSFFIGLVAGGALTISIFVGTLVGSLIPLIMHRLKADPAVASGPLITTICDILSMAIYFSIATLLMSKLI